MTLAYLFWHRPRPGVSRWQYEMTLREFHARLADVAIPGLVDSWTARMAAVPWLDGLPGYEDRYLIRDFAALDALNQAAVAPRQRAAHDTLAEWAADGTAGIYRLVSGRTLRAATAASWFGKPDGVGYRDFLDDLDIGDCSLWQRQLTLGPTPEFHATGLAPLAFAEHQLDMALL